MKHRILLLSSMTFVLTIACAEDSPIARHEDGGMDDAGGDAGSTRDSGTDPDAGDCPEDLATAVGERCSPEGRYCGSCPDPCTFCNKLQCVDGRWARVEVAPDPGACTDAGSSPCISLQTGEDTYTIGTDEGFGGMLRSSCTSARYSHVRDGFAAPENEDKVYIPNGERSDASIQVLDGDDWIRAPIPMGTEAGASKRIEAGASYELLRHPLPSKDSSADPMPGTYRIRLRVFPSNEYNSSQAETVYSNEFEVVDGG